MTAVADIKEDTRARVVVAIQQVRNVKEHCQLSATSKRGSMPMASASNTNWLQTTNIFERKLCLQSVKSYQTSSREYFSPPAKLFGLTPIHDIQQCFWLHNLHYSYIQVTRSAKYPTSDSDLQVARRNSRLKAFSLVPSGIAVHKVMAGLMLFPKPTEV